MNLLLDSDWHYASIDSSNVDIWSRPMASANVFLSHIKGEAGLAALLKAAIEEDFLIDVFSFSDPSTNKVGGRWLENITGNLRAMDLMIILASPDSIKKPWINFEAGAGWVSNKPVVPACHSGQHKDDLPVPLNQLQAMMLSDPADLKSLYLTLSEAAKCKPPSRDFETLARALAREEAQVTDRPYRHVISEMMRTAPEMYQILKSAEPFGEEGANVRELVARRFDKAERFLIALQDAGYIRFSYAVTGNILGRPERLGGSGDCGPLNIAVLRALPSPLE